MIFKLLEKSFLCMHAYIQHIVYQSFVSKIEKMILDCGLMSFFRYNCTWKLLKILLKVFLSVQINHACIIPALYKPGSFLTVRPGYILPVYVLLKKFHRQM